jgi:hypothetical protein
MTFRKVSSAQRRVLCALRVTAFHGRAAHRPQCGPFGRTTATDVTFAPGHLGVTGSFVLNHPTFTGEGHATSGAGTEGQDG